MSSGRILVGILNALMGLVLFLACYVKGVNIYVAAGCFAGILFASSVLIFSAFDTRPRPPKSYVAPRHSRRVN